MVRAGALSGGLTAYALCRDLGRSRLASVLGGIVYSLAGYVAYTDSPQMLHGAIWAPLVFLFLFRAERSESGVDGGQVGNLPHSVGNAVLSGFFLGVSWLVGTIRCRFFCRWRWRGLGVDVDKRSQESGVRSQNSAVGFAGFWDDCFDLARFRLFRRRSMGGWRCGGSGPMSRRGWVKRCLIRFMRSMG